MDRRGFLGVCLAAAAAPYVVTNAGVLMRQAKVLTLDTRALVLELDAAGGDFQAFQLAMLRSISDGLDVPFNMLVDHCRDVSYRPVEKQSPADFTGLCGAAVAGTGSRWQYLARPRRRLSTTARRK